MNNSKKTVRIIDPSKDERWDQFVLHHDDGSIYHHSLWKELIQNTYNYEPMYFIVENGQNEIKAGVPFFLVKNRLTKTRMISLPFSDYSDPLFSDYDDLDRIFFKILEEFKEINADELQFKLKKNEVQFQNYPLNKQVLDFNHIIKISDDLNHLKTKFSKDVKRCLKKAFKANVEVKIGADEKDLKIFFSLYIKTRKKIGLPPTPFAFFSHLLELLKPKDMINIHIAYLNSRPIAASLSTVFKDTLYSMFACSDSDYLKIHPNHLIIWNELELAVKKKLKFYDFGRTSFDNEGLLAFKRKWNSQEKKLFYFYYPASENRSNFKENLRDLYGVVCKRLPNAAYLLSGRLIYRHIY